MECILLRQLANRIFRRTFPPLVVRLRTSQAPDLVHVLLERLNISDLMPVLCAAHCWIWPD